MELEQLLINLVRNASEAGAVHAAAVRTRGAPDRVHLTIEDNGRGIPPEALERVFDPFYTTRVQRGGTGLGLSIVHSIVQHHGGTVEMRPMVPGTAVEIALPRSDPHSTVGS